MGMNVEIAIGNQVVYEGRLSMALAHTIVACCPEHTHTDRGRTCLDCGGRITNGDAIQAIHDNLWASLQQSQDLGDIQARHRLVKVVKEGEALMRVVQCLQYAEPPVVAISWG